VFALHGGQGLIERWVLSMNLSPLGFQFTAQLIIFLLGWPLEWTEIIVIFCPIFIPLLSHFQVDPILFGTMVAVNLQAAFLSPPVADVGVLPEGRVAQARDAEPDLRRDDAVHDHCLHLPRVHVHLARYDPLAPGVSLREITLGGGLRPPSDGRRAPDGALLPASP